ncbi:hypothetical protein BC834DRAFT_1043708 [Gloeopeniophorella convolvens]|nr:hypothetical protein BC834DRAFT_1043708 [Gloeopeniophorella convolvens]
MAILQPTPLPLNSYDPTTNKACRIALDSCILLERMDHWEVSLGQSHLMSSPDCVAREITARNDDPEILAGLAHLYIFGFIRIFSNFKGPTPLASANHSPRQPFRAAVIHHAPALAPAGATPRRLKEQLLRRDRDRCIFTHKPDFLAPRSPGPRISRGLPLDPTSLSVTHIISQSLSEGIGGMTKAARDKLRWAHSAAAILDRFAGIEIRTILNDLDVHNAANAMMADHAPHILFDTLRMWLTPALEDEQNVIPDTYDVNLVDPSIFDVYPSLLQRISFQENMSPDGDVVPPPSPVLLKLHAACAKIACVSGAAEVLDDFYRDSEPMGGLSVSYQDMSFNPAGAAELVRALNRVQLGGA